MRELEKWLRKKWRCAGAQQVRCQKNEGMRFSESEFSGQGIAGKREKEHVTTGFGDESDRKPEENLVGMWLRACLKIPL